MPKNKSLGGKGFKKGKKTGGQFTARPLILKERDGTQRYAIIEKALGNCNMSVKCDDDIVRIGHIRGALRNKAKMGVGDYVIVSIRGFQDNKCDILHSFNGEEVRKLRKMTNELGSLQDDQRDEFYGDDDAPIFSAPAVTKDEHEDAKDLASEESFNIDDI